MTKSLLLKMIFMNLRPNHDTSARFLCVGWGSSWFCELLKDWLIMFHCHPWLKLGRWTRKWHSSASVQDRKIDNEDVVVWHTFGVTHVPRPEDWPVMPVEMVGFILKPAGFFDVNPALDLPPGAQGTNVEVSCPSASGNRLSLMWGRTSRYLYLIL